MLRRFKLVREIDVTGVSGTGVVGLGVMFPDGSCVMQWQTRLQSTVIYPTVALVEEIHGHDGATRLVWIDE